MTELAQRILACVESIPPGRVMTYGDVAEYVGANSARIVGRVLALDDGSVPWHRVLRADGSLAEHLYTEQRQRLLAEGVRFRGDRVELAAFRWDGLSAAETSLDGRLARAGVKPGMAPLDAWRRLHQLEGPQATVLDLYELVARPRGLAAHELPQTERRALARAVMPDVWPGWETAEGSERRVDRIKIADYDPEWPARFDRCRRRLQSALGAVALRIDHVGSTAVPGLAAKPVIDIQVSVADLAEESAYVPPIESAGLQLRSRDGLHRYFRPHADRPRDVHVHVCAAGSVWEEEHLCFRDYLRTHPAARDAYAEAKREAAARWADDRFAYTDAKSEIILQILSAAGASR